MASNTVELIDNKPHALHDRVAELERLVRVHSELLERHLGVEPPRTTMLKRINNYDKQLEKKRRKRSKKKKRLTSDAAEALEDMKNGHEHLNAHGYFYDENEDRRICIYQGTNCGMYWAVHAAGEYADDEEGKQRREADQKLAKSIQLASALPESESEMNALSPLVMQAMDQQHAKLRYLMRYNNDGEKQYVRDVR